MALATNIIQTIGNTPLIKLERISREVGAEIFIKGEFFNPMASVKDRIGRAMIEATELV